MTAHGQSARACAPAGPGGAVPGRAVPCGGNPVPPVAYRFRVGGLLDDRWAGWFSGLTLSREGDGSTTLHGPVPDQAALHGLLARIRDLGLTLISVEVVEQPDARHGQQP